MTTIDTTGRSRDPSFAVKFRPKGSTSEALRACLADVEAALALLRRDILEMEQDRGSVLLDGSAAEVGSFEKALADSRADAEQLAAIGAALPARIAEAEARERSVELDATARDAETNATVAAALVPQIVQALGAAAEMIERYDALALRVHSANRLLFAEKRDRVTMPLARVWHHDPAGERPITLGEAFSLPGPRGACRTLSQWRADLARAETTPPT